MPTEFYVKNIDKGLVPAHHLKIDGVRVLDKNTEWAKGIELWDASGNFLGKNTIGYLVAPADYTFERSKDIGADLRAMGAPAGLATMAAAFWQKGSEDLQRTYTGYDGNLVIGGPVVVAFQSVASLHVGATTTAAGYPLAAAEVGGGVMNWFIGGQNTAAFSGNHPRNIVSMEQGAQYVTNPPQPLVIGDGFQFLDSLHGITMPPTASRPRPSTRTTAPPGPMPMTPPTPSRGPGRRPTSTSTGTGCPR